MNHKNMLVLAAGVTMCLPASGWPAVMDRTASLPAAEIIQDVRDARADYEAYEEAQAEADKAAQTLLKGLPGVPKEQKDVERAKLIGLIIASLQKVHARMAGFKASMEMVVDKLKGVVVAELGDADAELAGMLEEFEAGQKQHAEVIDRVVAVADMANDELPEAEQRKLNSLISNYRFRDRVSQSLSLSRERLAGMQGTIEGKLTVMDAAVKAVDARLKDIKGEIAVMKTLRTLDAVSKVFCVVFRCKDGGSMEDAELTFSNTENVKALVDSAGKPASGDRTLQRATAQGNLDWWKTNSGRN